MSMFNINKHKHFHIIGDKNNKELIEISLYNRVGMFFLTLILILVFCIFFNLLIPQQKVNINACKKEVLMVELYSTSEVKASKIILNRPYEDIYELLEREIMTEYWLQMNIDKIKVGSEINDKK